jgi:hypothetical protein
MTHVKGKFHPRTGHEGPAKELRYSCTFSLILGARSCCGHPHAPAAAPPRDKDTIPFVMEAGCAPGLVSMGAENFALTRV